ncbi:MAG TPA: formate dehydrogenase accessory sulfurtransferase FdhD, partial [Rubrivivax sp.]|nr:formate dehydrogenase accessory sulfurtransferase FdhD [Rubrivivax sp.]
MTAAAVSIAMRPAPPSPCPGPGEDEALAPVASVAVRRWQDGQSGEGVDWVCEEQPVSLEYNGISHAVMMATPTALEDFALGFSLTEGIVAATTEILEMQLQRHEHGLCVAMRITARRESALRERRRTLAGRTGCGLCGIDS